MTDVGRAHWSTEVKTLGHAARELARRTSMRIIAVVVLGLAAARVAVGGFGAADAIAAAAMVAIYPIGEWLIHVYVLHSRPKRGSYLAAIAAGHRAHHRSPNDLTMILLEPRDIAALLFGAMPLSFLAWAVPMTVITGSFPLGPALSAALVTTVLIGIYEWTHYLIHTAYRPRSRYYRRIWRTHRLHHFKNEHYWHGITNTVADRVLGTFPDHHEVERSPTAKTLDSGPTATSH